MSLQHIFKNSSVSGKEPLANQLANGELSVNYHADGPFLCCKDTAGNVRRVAGVWVATTAPSTPFPGELWLDTSIMPSQLKVYKNTTDNWVFAGAVNPATTTYAGVVQLATNGETQAGTNATSAVTPAGLQSKISDSTSTVSSTTIASSTAVKSVGDLASAALPKSGGTITGTLEIGNTGQLRFEGSSNDAYETTLAVEDPTTPRTITLPDRSGTVITTGDSETVTNTMLAGSIADSKLSTITTADKVSLSALNIDGAIDIGAALSDADLFIVDDGANGTNRKAPATRISDYTFGKISGAVTIANNGTSSLGTGVIVNSNVSNTAAIAGTKVSPDFGSQNITTTGNLGIGTSSPGSLLDLRFATSPATDNGIGANALRVFTSNTLAANAGGAIALGGTNTSGGAVGSYGQIAGRKENATSENYAGYLQFATNASNGVMSERLRIDSSGRVGIGTSSPNARLVVQSDSTDTTFSTPYLNYGAVLRNDNQTNNNYSAFSFNTLNSTGSDTTVASIGAQCTNHTAGAINGVLGFFVTQNNLLSERARIDSSGRLLVGTSTARTSASHTGSIQLEGTTFSTSTISIIGDANDASGSYIHLGKARGGSIGSTTIVADGDTLGQIHFTGADGTNLINAAFIAAQVDGTPGANDMPGRLVFSTTADGASSPTERMRIMNTGVTNMFSSSTDVFVSRSGNAAGTTNFLIRGTFSASGTTDGTVSFQVATNGNVTNTNNSYGAISDIKLKENIVDANSQWEDLKALQVRKYNFKEGQTHTQIGLVAQEVEEVSPGLVIETADRDAEGNDLGTVTKSVNYSVLYMKAVKALQEAMERIETLEAKVAALESV